MESWRGPDVNIYTTNSTRWVQLLNLSTVEWNIGYFPPNIVAIPGDLNETSSTGIPAGSVVIPNASRADLGTRAVEKVVFGVTSGLVILGAGIWLFLHWKNDTLFAPRNKPGTDHDSTRARQYGGVFGGSDAAMTHELRSLSGASRATPGPPDGSINTDMAAAESGVVPHHLFRQKLTRFYYEGLDTELEVYEKDERDGEPDGNDVEKVTEKLRRMYDLDLRYWARQDAARFRTNRGELERIRDQSHAIWTEVRATVAGWQQRRDPPVRWNPQEEDTLNDIAHTLSHMGEVRRH